MEFPLLGDFCGNGSRRGRSAAFGFTAPCARAMIAPTKDQGRTSMAPVVRGLALLAALALASGALAQSYPDRPVKLIVPFPAGGPADLIARIIGQKLSEDFGRQFYVQNHSGA